METKKHLKIRFKEAIFGCFLVFISIFGGVFGGVIDSPKVFAEPTDEATTVNEDKNGDEATGSNESDKAKEPRESMTGDNCQDALGALGWIVCPTTEKISEATDWLYEKIEGILVIEPISVEDGSPIYEIWKYCRGLTNIVFIIFLLVVIYSQITGVGISNYGIKKALPKLIIAAILVNLSFLICSLAVDLSNIIGNSLRGLFTSVESSVMENIAATAANNGVTEMTPEMRLSYASMYSSLESGTTLLVGAGLIMFETGAIWMLIPVVLGAIVAVASGLITIALRQAVVALLVMISPLAIVAYILPNTEDLFKKWKKLFIKMLVFYPLFSLLFGASDLAGFAIMMSAKDGFGVLLGVAVQVFPLFFSWSLMKMSGTFLGTINAKLRGMAARPLAANRAWADSRRQLTRARTLTSTNIYTPSRGLMRFMSDRKVAREAEIKERGENAAKRGMAYYRGSRYKRNGESSRKGVEAYKRIMENMAYDEVVKRDDNNMEKGLGEIKVNAKSARIGELKALDGRVVMASDRLKMENARGAMIELENARGFHERISNAMTAHADLEAIQSGDKSRLIHGAINDANVSRYKDMLNIMEGKVEDTHFVGADAAHAFNAQAQIVKGKFLDYFNLTVPTQDVVHRLNELTKSKNSSDYMDSIISGMRVLNARGDTDLVRHQVVNLLSNEKMELGTYASQSLASFLMFDVKGNDPILRRLGKYINLETAAIYNDREVEEMGKRRTKRTISLDEYINSEYIDKDAEGNVIYEDGKPKIRKVKKGAPVLLKGTSFKDMERTAMADMTEFIRDCSVDPNTGEFEYERFKRNEEAIWNAIMPNVISDHFSFLSGSEQIMAFGKGLTGVDVAKHGFDWEGIFGKEIASKLTSDQKKDYIDFLNKRTKTFLGGQVPSQIAKTKTDMLESIRNQYVLKEMLDNNPELIEEFGKVGSGMDNDKYKEAESKHIDGVRKEFVKSFKEDALKGFVKMHHKGYQGEAKDGLIQMLNPDELYDKFFRNGDGQQDNNKNKARKIREDDDEEEGKPVESDVGVGGGEGNPVYSRTREEIERIYDDYRGSRNTDVEGFWEEVKRVMVMSDEPQMVEEYGRVAMDIDEMLPQFTNTGALLNYIMNRFFGGF